MNRLRLLLSSAVLATAVLTVPHAVPAAADLCYIKIKWNEKEQQWEWASDDDWECEFCVPFITAPPDVEPNPLERLVPWQDLEALLEKVGAGGVVPTDPPAVSDVVHHADSVAGTIVGTVRNVLVGEPYPEPLPDGPGCPLGWEPRDPDGKD